MSKKDKVEVPVLLLKMRSNGEELFGACEVDEEKQMIFIHQPASYRTTPTNGGEPDIKIEPWLPMAGVNVFPIPMADIMLMIPVSESLASWYMGNFYHDPDQPKIITPPHKEIVTSING